jgi:hypothetical protein
LTTCSPNNPNNQVLLVGSREPHVQSPPQRPTMLRYGAGRRLPHEEWR